MQSVGRTLLVFGLILALAGGLMLLLSRLGIGPLPGDITIRRGGLRISVLIGTSILVSVVLTIILNLLIRR